MGHYLGDNSQEVYLALAYKPISRFMIELAWWQAQKGYEYLYNGISGDPQGNGKGLPFIDRVYWQDTEASVKAKYQLINDAWIFAGFTHSDIHGIDETTYTMPWMIGKQNTIQFGANVGF